MEARRPADEQFDFGSLRRKLGDGSAEARIR